MKKFLPKMLLCAIVSFLFVACSDDDDKIKISKQSISMFAKEEYQLTVNTNDEVVWSSEDEFIATIPDNDGKVIANHVGKTYIKADDAMCEVIVKAKHDLYEDPITQWGLTRDEVIKLLGTPKSTSDKIISYDTNNAKAPLIAYLFDDEGKLYAACPYVKTIYTETLLDFLIERYLLIDADIEKLSATFINANTIAKSTMLIEMSPEKSLTYYMVIYLDMNKTRTIDNGVKEYFLDFLESYN